MRVDVRHRDSAIILELKGEITGTTVSDLKKVIHDQLTNVAGAPKFLIDLADVSMIDSSGLGTLMETHISIARKSGWIAVINGGTKIKNLIVRLRLSAVFG